MGQSGKGHDRLALATPPSALGSDAWRGDHPAPFGRCSMDWPAEEERCVAASRELDARMNSSRQTMDFVRARRARFAKLDRGALTVWQVLDALEDLAPGSRERALYTADAAAKLFPALPWMPVVGLLARVGEVLGHDRWGSEPSWLLHAESFPVGCRVRAAVAASAFAFTNPDRRRKAYSTPTGMYSTGCGLENVYMSWTGAEYLYMVLSLNGSRLPPEALFLLRHQSFKALFKPGKPYHELLSPSDRAWLPLLLQFQELLAETSAPLPAACPAQRPPLGGRRPSLHVELAEQHYTAALRRYFQSPELRW